LGGILRLDGAEAGPAQCRCRQGNEPFSHDRAPGIVLDSHLSLGEQNVGPNGTFGSGCSVLDMGVEETFAQDA
jgi:hypothetical protein